MKTVGCIIVDDEKSGREILELLITKHLPTLKVLATCSSATEGVEMCRKLKPEIVFLDIEMPLAGGFDFLKKFNPVDFKIIFVTAHNEYAIDAFKVSAIDYLLKPVKISDLQESVHKALKQIVSQAKDDKIEFLLAELSNKNPQQNKIVIPTQSGYDILPVSDIIRLESDVNYTIFHLINKKQLVSSKTLKEYEGSLKSRGFHRVHRSHMVNMQHVVKYNKNDGGYLIMSDESTIEVTRDRKEEFLKSLMDY